MKRAIIYLLLICSSCSKVLGDRDPYICIDSQGNDRGEQVMTSKQKEKYEKENQCQCYAQ